MSGNPTMPIHTFEYHLPDVQFKFPISNQIIIGNLSHSCQSTLRILLAVANFNSVSLTLAQTLITPRSKIQFSSVKK